MAADPFGDHAENLAPNAHYVAGLEAGELRYQRCGDCGSAVFMPRVLCNICGSANLRFEVSAGNGTVYSATAVTQRDAPSYSVALVDLDEGFRMMSAVVDMVAEEVEIGMRVSARVEPIEKPEAAAGQTLRVVFAAAS